MQNYIFSRFWDMFKVIPRERKTQDVHTFRSLRIIKVFAYFILFLMLLASLVIQKISVITLISQLRPEKIWNGESEQSDKVQNNKVFFYYCLTTQCSLQIVQKLYMTGKLINLKNLIINFVYLYLYDPHIENMVIILVLDVKIIGYFSELQR